MIDIIDRLIFDAARCEATFSKGVAGNITEGANEIKRLRAQIVDMDLDRTHNAQERDRLRAEIAQCAVELGEAAKLIQKHYPRTASLFEEACGRARISIGLTPCEPA